MTCPRFWTPRVGRPPSRALCSSLALTLALFAACTSSEGRGSDRKAGALQIQDEDGGVEEAVPVEVIALGTGPIEEVLRFSTNLTAENQVQVLARAPGLITRLTVEEGDEVKRNQVLVSLESDEQRVQLLRVENDLERAQRLFDRQKSLRESGVVSEESFQSARFDLQRLELMKKDAARALRFTSVRAPIAGTITRRLVKRGDTVAISQPLFDVTDFDSIVAPVFVPEKDFPKLSVEQGARIVTQARSAAGTAGERRRFQGAVARIAPLVDPTSGTVKATIAVPRAEGLMPGMFVEVELITATHEQAVLLPKRALIYDNDVPYAFRLEGDRVRRIRVEPLLENRDDIEPQSGFSAGDQIVIAGQVGLKDGALVTVPEARSSAAKSPAPAEKPPTRAAATADGSADKSGDESGDKSADGAAAKKAP